MFLERGEAYSFNSSDKVTGYPVCTDNGMYIKSSYEHRTDI